MKGNKGTCQIFADNGKLILKTKFDTEQNSQNRINVLLSVSAAKPDTTTYKCKTCNFWHLGTLEEKQTYGK